MITSAKCQISDGRTRSCRQSFLSLPNCSCWGIPTKAFGLASAPSWAPVSFQAIPVIPFWQFSSEDPTLSGVYLEMVVKRPGDSLWLRNFQLCFLSSLIGLISALVLTSHQVKSTRKARWWASICLCGPSFSSRVCCLPVQSQSNNKSL